MWYIWLIAAGVCFVFEIATVGFLIFWLGIGALLSMCVSFFTNNLIIQTSVFVISSGLLIFFTKPFVNKFTKKDTTPTNAYSVIEKKGIVIIEINSIEATGQVKIEGEIWSAKSAEGSVISVGTEVKVLKIDGVKVLVEPTSKVLI